MKKILLTLLLGFCVLCNSQIMKTKALEFISIDETKRNTLVLGSNDRYIIFNSTSGKLEKWDGSSWIEIGGRVISNHEELNNIGTNTHDQIDSHIANGNVHYTQSAINITSSQVSDFDSSVQNNTAVQNNTSKISFVDAPSDGTLYTRSNGFWVQLTGNSQFNNAISSNPDVVANTAKISFPNNPQDGEVYARFNNSWANISHSYIPVPSFVQVSTSTISLINKGGTYYTANNTHTTYTVQNTNSYGGMAFVIIDSSGMTEYPVVTGATLIQSPDFEAGKHRMTVFNEAGTIKYFFTKE